jgi:hypothetical protein
MRLDQLGGLWRRSLIRLPDGTEDRTTEVHWLQGPSCYADLRQPAERPSFAGVTCLRDCGPDHLAWMARQEGFAGRLVQAGDFFEWEREIDFQPPSATPDAGRLWLEDGMMKEEGRDNPYLEHWHSCPAGEPSAALTLVEDATGVTAALVVVGSVFMFARARATVLPVGATLSDLLAEAPDATAAQNLLDCEISLGAVEDGQFLVQRSTLPFREGAELRPFRDKNRFTMAGINPTGAALTQVWRIGEEEGDAVRWKSYGL